MNRGTYRYCTDCKHWVRKGAGYTGICAYAATHLRGVKVVTDCLQRCILDPPQWERTAPRKRSASRSELGET